MNGRRPASRLLPMVAALGLAAVLTSFPGCGPTSEGRPAGSIEVKPARTSAADVDALKAKAKAKPSRTRRP